MYEVYNGHSITLNTGLSHPQERWSTVHGFSHHHFDSGNQYRLPFWTKWKMERRAELFAGYLLMGDPQERPAWWLAERHEIPIERVLRWLDLRAGWLALSSSDARLAHYRLLAHQPDADLYAPHRWNYA